MRYTDDRVYNAPQIHNGHSEHLGGVVVTFLVLSLRKITASIAEISCTSKPNKYMPP